MLLLVNLIHEDMVTLGEFVASFPAAEGVQDMTAALAMGVAKSLLPCPPPPIGRGPHTAIMLSMQGIPSIRDVIKLLA